MNNAEKLQAWIARSGRKLGHIANEWLVTRETLTKWRKGESEPQGAARLWVEHATGGEVPADQWGEK